jgi:hypothetical protein
MAIEPTQVFNKPIGELTTDEQKSVVDIYKVLIDMADKVSQRRQNANNFYLSVNTAITGAAAYLSATGNSSANIFIISLAGFLVCLLWKRNIDSYKDLNKGKFFVIHEIEKALPIAAFTAEWDFLQRGENRKHYRPFHVVEVIVPFIFAGLHLAQCLRLIPWGWLFTFVR